VKRFVFACVVAVAVWASPANGQPAAKADRSTAAPDRSTQLDVRIPQLIAYQGKLTDSTGRPVDDGGYVMVFSLSADSTGSSFWHETQTVETKGGLFNVLLGSSVPIPADSVPQGGCYLGVRVLPSTQEFRRQRIASVPFAFQADNSDKLQGRDTTALWNAKTLQGKDTTGFVRTSQADAVTSAMIVDGTIASGDVAAGFKAPYADTADYAKAAPATDSARVAGNAHQLQGKDTTALWNAKTLQGKDTSGFVRTDQVNSVTGAMLVDGTIVRVDVAAGFKAPFSDTADYAKLAPAADSARVAGNSHLLQGKDTTALWNAKTLQGKDTAALDTRYVNEGQAGSIASTMIRDSAVGTVQIRDSAVIGGKIAFGAVAANEIADNSVTTSDIKDGTVTSADMATSGVAAGTYGDGYHVARITVDSVGRLTAASDTTILGAAPSGPAGGDLSGNYPNPAIAKLQGNPVSAASPNDGQVLKWNGSAWTPRTDSTGGTAGGDLTGNYPNPTIATDKVTSAKILDGTIARADVASIFKAPYSDTADYAKTAPAVDSARVAGNSHQLQGKDTTALWNAKTLQGKDTSALWNAKTLQGKDTSGFVRTNQANSVTSAMVVNGTIVRADVAASFKAPYADTADYASSAPASDSARVAGNSHLLLGKDTTALWNAKTLQGKDTAALWNAKTLQGKDTSALWNAKTLQGKDTSGFVRTNQANSVSSAMIVNGTIVRADVAANFKAPYADTADYAGSAPASDSARVAGNSHLLQGKDTTALWNAKTLQGKDTSALWNAKTLQGKDTAALWNAKTLQGKDTAGFVRANQSNSVTSAMIVNGTIVRGDVAASFKAPYSDTADYASSAPASDSARVAGNSHLLLGKDTTALWNAKTLQGKDTAALWNAKSLQGKDTTGFVRTGQANSITTGMIANGEVQTADIGDGNVTAAKIAANAVDSTRIADGSVIGADIKDRTITSSDLTKTGVVAGTYGDGYHVARITVDSAGRLTSASDSTILGASPTGPAGGDLTGNYPNPTIAANAVTSAKILDGTLLRADVAAGFKAPYSDTADYAKAAPASDSARVAGNSHLLQGKDTTALWNAKTLQGKDTVALWNAKTLQGKDTTALWNAKTLQGKDTTGFVRTGQADAVTSAMIVNGTVARSDVATNFKAPFADTADYAKAAPAVDSARVAGNSHQLQGKDTTALWNAKTLQGKDTAALWNAKTLQGKDTTALDARFVNEGQAASGDLTGSYPNPTVAANSVTSAKILDGTIARADVASSFKAPYSDTADYAKAAPAVDSARVAGNSHQLQGKDTTALWNAKALQGKDTSGFVRTDQANSVTSAMIVNGTVARSDVATNFKAPFADTADYAISAPASDSARVAGNSHLLQGKDTTALWNAKTLQGKDTTALDARYVNEAQTAGGDLTGSYPNPTIATDKVTSAKILDGTILRADVAASFKAPYADTADYAKTAPAVDSARVAGNSHLLQNKDTTALWNAKTLQGKDTTALWNAKTLQGKDTTALWNAKTLQGKDTTVLWNAKTLQGKDTTGFVRTNQASSISSAMIVDGTVVRADVSASFKAPYSDTADYAKAAPAVDSARVAGNSHQLQGKDTTALWNAKTLQGKDTTGFVRTGQADAVTSAMIVNGTVARSDVAANFKAPYSDTADYASSAPAADSARVAGNSHLLLGKDTTALWNAKTLQGKDTAALWNAKTLQGKDTTALDARYVNEGQASSVTSNMIVDGTIAAGDLGQMGASNGQVMKWSGSAWVPANDSVGTGGSGTVRKVFQSTGVVVSPNPITDSGTVRFDSTWGDARFVNESQSAGGDLTGTYPNPSLASVGSGGSYTLASITVDAKGRVTAASNGTAVQGVTATSPLVSSGGVYPNIALDTAMSGDLTGAYPHPTIGANKVTSNKILDGTIVRADVAANFKAPYSDTADYAIAAPASDSARVAGNSHLLQGKDTTALWNAKTLQGKDTSALWNAKTLQGKDTAALWNAKTLQGKDTAGFVRTGQLDAVTSAMIVSGTVARSDVATNFKAPFADTADYAISAPASDSARVAGNSHLLQGKDTTALWNAKALQGKDTTALWNAKTLQGKDTTAFVLAGQANSIVAAMVVDTNVTMAKLQRAGAITGQVIKWNGSGWAPGNDSIGGGYLASVSQASGVICSPNPITTSGTVGFDSTWGDGRYVNEGQSAGGDLTGLYPSPSLASVGAAGSYALASITVDAKGRVTAASNGNAVSSVSGTSPISSSGGQNPIISLATTMGGDLTGSYPNPAIAANAVALGKIARGSGADSGKAIVARGSGSDPAWGYPAAIGDSSPTAMKFLRFGTVSVDFPNANGPATVETTATISGVKVGDLVYVFSSSTFDTRFILSATCSVTANDVIRLRACLPTNQTANPASDNMRYIWLRP